MEENQPKKPKPEKRKQRPLPPPRKANGHQDHPGRLPLHLFNALKEQCDDGFFLVRFVEGQFFVSTHYRSGVAASAMVQVLRDYVRHDDICEIEKSRRIANED